MSDIKAVILTYDEIFILADYISMTAKDRKEKAAAWESLLAEKKPDGTPKYPYAGRNARYWRRKSEQLAAIMKKLEE